MEHLIGIGEYCVTTRPEDSIKTYALSTCVAIVAYCPFCKALGMAHVALPDSSISEDPDMEPEARYADIAVDILLEDMFDKKSCPYRNVDLYLYGGISSRQGDFFKTGEENVKSIKKAIFMKNLKVAFEDTGGFTTRTVTAYANDGAVLVDRLPKIMF